MTSAHELTDNITLSFERNDRVKQIVGPADQHIRWLEKTLNTRITANGNTINIKGPPSAVEQGQAVLKTLYAWAHPDRVIGMEQVESALLMTRPFDRQAHFCDSTVNENALNADGLQIRTRKKCVEPRSPIQARMLKAMSRSTVVFAIGPAGTGKTYLAVAQAVAALEANRARRIVLCRPAIEAGEQLGFLPGDMREKVDPYFRPLYDALNELMGPPRIEKLIENGQIEIAPLAFMRGRTLSDAFIILDEAQNCNRLQMKMLLTRIGQGSRLVICGDPGQSDLPKGQTSGLGEAIDVLDGIDDIETVVFGENDVVRHALVGAIIRAYNQAT